MLAIDKYVLEIELEEDLLGSTPKQREVYTSYVQAKAREAMLKGAAKKEPVPLADGGAATAEAVEERLDEEPENIKEVEERGWTGFMEDDQGVFLYDYAFKGFLCEAAGTLKQWGTTKALKDKFKRHVFIKPRRLRLTTAAGAPVKEPDATLERPLRAMTQLGPRVTLARSDVIKAGSRLCLHLHVLKGAGITHKCLQDVLEYGGYMGLGQWRSGGFGRFRVVKLELVEAAKKSAAGRPAPEGEGEGNGDGEGDE